MGEDTSSWVTINNILLVMFTKDKIGPGVVPLKSRKTKSFPKITSFTRYPSRNIDH